jgi:phosphocarrier protein
VSAPSKPPERRGGGREAKSFRATVTIANRRGLHARAAAKFVKVAEQFVAEIEVAKDDMVVAGTSIMGLMVLAAAPGSELEVRARGREAKAALAALVALVERGFDEE